MNNRTNDIGMPRWLQSKKLTEPEGTYTPDQVADAIQINMLLNGDTQSLRNCIRGLIKKVPLKNQPMLGAFIAGDDKHLVACVKAYLESVQQKLDALPKEQPDGKVQAPRTSRESIGSARSDDWEDDWGSDHRSRPSTRGQRAVRAAKRQQADFRS